MKSTIPAIRIAVAVSLNRRGMSETEIARSLGIAQAAVSKYLSGKYAENIRVLVALIEKEALHENVVRAVLTKSGNEPIADLIDKAASNKKLVERAAKLK